MPILIFLIAIIGVSEQIWSSESPCYLDIERHFFNEELVNQAFASQNISQSNWSLIFKTLKDNNRKIAAIVRDRAKKMNPDPFGSPFRQVDAGKILVQVQYEVFVETLASFGFHSAIGVKQMFFYIRDKQAQKLTACFGKELMNLEPSR